MTKLSINLTPKFRLDLKLVKTRKGVAAEPLFPHISQLRKFRSGNKISRTFRHIFEHKKIRRILGSNLALIILASSLIPTQTSAQNINEDNIISVEITPLTTERPITYPVENHIINQVYKFYHPAIDYEGITGDPINPIMAGTISEVQYSRFAYGNAIIIDHGNNITSLYAHLSKIEVKKDQFVTPSDKIGEIGSTGRSTGDHLHFELRFNGRPVNPEPYLSRRVTLPDQL